MKITKELDLTTFEFWSGAKDFAKKLTYSELKELEFILNDLFSEGATETEINDLFWFDDESICEWLNLEIGDVYER